MIGSPYVGAKFSVLDASGAVVAPDAIYTGAASRYTNGEKVDLRVFGLPDGSRLVVEAETATLGPVIKEGVPA